MDERCLCVRCSLWAQLSSPQTSDSKDAASMAKTQFLQKMKTTVFFLGLWDPQSGSCGWFRPGEFKEELQQGPEPLWGPVFGGRGRGRTWLQRRFPDPCPVGLAWLWPCRCGGRGGGWAPAEGLLTDETANGGSALCR